MIGNCVGIEYRWLLPQKTIFVDSDCFESHSLYIQPCGSACHATYFDDDNKVNLACTISRENYVIQCGQRHIQKGICPIFQIKIHFFTKSDLNTHFQYYFQRDKKY